MAPDSLDAAGLWLIVPTTSLSVQNDVSDKDPREIEQNMRERVLETATHTEIRQTDFGITPVSVAGRALTLKDELTCSFDVLARKAT